MTHDPEWQKGHDAVIHALENPTPELVEAMLKAWNQVRLSAARNISGETIYRLAAYDAMKAALTAAAAYLFAENANKSTGQFAQNANCPGLKGQKAGANARAMRKTQSDNPYYRSDQMPAATGQDVEEWNALAEAWNFGWQMEDVIRKRER
jgi:hypothetical protein